MTLEERVGLLEQVVLYDCSVSKLALSCKFDSAKIESIYQIFKKYSSKCDEKIEFSYMEVEKDFGKIGINYQLLKSVILAFGDANKYLDVIAQYLKSNKEKMSGLSCEYHRLYDRVFSK
nr:hypothetical protein [uncultured Campylobacter sp.]